MADYKRNHPKPLLNSTFSAGAKQNRKQITMLNIYQNKYIEMCMSLCVVEPTEQRDPLTWMLTVSYAIDYS